MYALKASWLILRHNSMVELVTFNNLVNGSNPFAFTLQYDVSA